MTLVPDGKNFRSTLSPNHSFIVGNENAGSFEPHIRAMRWGGEGSFSFGLPGRGIPSAFRNGKVEWTDGDQLHRFYEREANSVRWPQGGFEYDIVFGVKPQSRILSIPIDITGLEARFQGELSPFAVARGCTRPPDVVGSYAFYHATKGKMNSTKDAAKDYKTGKAFHLYRPECVDALGVRQFMDMKIVGSNLEIVLDPGYFNRATYPVTLDPTIGNTFEGASSDNTNNYLMCLIFTSGAISGTGVDMNIFAGHSSTGTGVLGVYDTAASTTHPDGNGLMSAGVTTSISGTTKAWYSPAYIWTIAASTQYWLAFNHVSGGTTAYDDLTGVNHYLSRTHSNDLPDPYGSDGGEWEGNISIYANYDEDAAGGVSPQYHHLRMMHSQ